MSLQWNGPDLADDDLLHKSIPFEAPGTPRSANRMGQLPIAQYMCQPAYEESEKMHKAIGSQLQNEYEWTSQSQSSWKFQEYQRVKTSCEEPPSEHNAGVAETQAFIVTTLCLNRGYPQ